MKRCRRPRANTVGRGLRASIATGRRKEGDVIRTIRDHHRWFGHYHTAGNPGRGEIDDRQELNCPAICRAIVATGFDGILAQQFTPTAEGPGGPERSLREAVALCDV